MEAFGKAFLEVHGSKTYGSVEGVALAAMRDDKGELIKHLVAFYNPKLADLEKRLIAMTAERDAALAAKARAERAAEDAQDWAHRRVAEAEQEAQQCANAADSTWAHLLAARGETRELRAALAKKQAELHEAKVKLAIEKMLPGLIDNGHVADDEADASKLSAFKPIAPSVEESWGGEEHDGCDECKAELAARAAAQESFEGGDSACSSIEKDHTADDDLYS
jgi:hypothetical protein